MRPQLTATQARVIGCLMEKAVVTPDQYPLTLNALANACNQKSARHPVMSLSQGEVQRAARELRDQQLVQVEEGARAGVEKYKQRLCNTNFSDFQFDPSEFAVICLLLLRGPQTPGELRANAGRLHRFPDNSAVLDTLTGLMDRDGEALVVELPRTPGRRDPEYMHQLCGPVDIEAHARRAKTENAGGSGVRGGVADLAERVDALEAEVADLKARLESLL